MTLCIRNPEADALAKRLAKLDETTITEAVIRALQEAVASRTRREGAQEAARRIITEHGLKIHNPGQTTPRSV
jgi:antitoxin VapB